MESSKSAQISLGKAIRARRKQLGYSQEGFALICGLDRAHVGQIERGNGNPTFTLLIQICGTLKYSLEELFRDAGL